VSVVAGWRSLTISSERAVVLEWAQGACWPGPAGDLAIFSAPRSRGGISDVPRHLTMKGREYRSDVHIQQAVESSPFGTSARVDSCSLLEPQDEEVVEDCMNTISANTQSHYPLPHL
jgi:hypothetical protein